MQSNYDWVQQFIRFDQPAPDVSQDALYEERDRAKIPEKYKWNLTDVYANEDEWRKAKQKLVAEIPQMDQYRERLSQSPHILLACLELISTLSKEYTRLYCFASLNSDLDTRDAKYLAMEQEMGQVGSDMAAKISFVEPEILKIDKAAIDGFIEQEEGLKIYRHSLYETLRRKEHTGTEGEERIIATASLMSDGPNSIYTIFSNADFPFPDLVFQEGKKVKLDKAAFALHRSSPNREDRKGVFEAYFGKLNEFRRTFGTQLYAEVKKNMFYSRARRYTSCLHHALDGSNIPLEVYHGLIDNVNAHLGTFHRYLRLRKRMLGVDTLQSYDLYAPLIEGIDLKYTLEEAKEHILDSLSPLGEDYVAVSRRSFAERWVDAFPNDGKRSGAYSNGAVYDVHPYMLLNYNGKYDDVSTLTHELGHTMHSYLSNKHQPYPTSRYSIFVAEVASTFNEALLMNYMLKTISDDDIRLSLLGNYLDGIRGTVFRQVQFSEFELKIHETAEGGESLTGDLLSSMYDEINRKYHGHEKGESVVDPFMSSEWAHIPHFYYNFYVYQYATSYTASTALSEQIIAGDTHARERYIELLSAGGSDYPIELLKKAGVDMTKPQPFELTMQKMNRVMDEMEKIFEKREKKNQ